MRFLSRKRSEDMEVDDGEDSDDGEDEKIVAESLVEIDAADSQIVLHLSDSQSTSSLSSFNDDPEIATGFQNDLHCAAHTIQLEGIRGDGLRHPTPKADTF